jgi:diguanylate cyclase (GGDEF)-like protein
MGQSAAFLVILLLNGCAILAFATWCWRKRHGWKPVVLMAVLLGLGVWLGKTTLDDAGQRDAGWVHEMLNGLAPTLASHLSGKDSESALAILNQWRKNNRVVHDVYTLQSTADGQFSFVAHPEAASTGSNQSDYLQNPAELKSAMSGKGSFDSRTVLTVADSDVVRAVEPILGSNGRPNGVLVVLYSNDLWERVAESNRTTQLTMQLLLLLMVVGGGVILTELLTTSGNLRVSKIELQTQSEMIKTHMKEIAEKNQQMAANQDALSEAYAKLRKMATTDSLTGVLNHRALMESLSHAMESNPSFASACSVILLDVDNFKQLNDQYGHIAGDDALRVMGTVLAQSVPHGAAVGRYGGEEFMIVLPGTSEATATAVAEEVRRRIQLAKTTSRPITVSVGVTTSYSGSKSNQSVIDEADRALYKSKRSGKNRVTHFGHGLLEAS